MYAAEMLVLSSSERPKTKHSMGNTLQSAFFLEDASEVTLVIDAWVLTRWPSLLPASNPVRDGHHYQAERAHTPSPGGQCLASRPACRAVTTGEVSCCGERSVVAIVVSKRQLQRTASLCIECCRLDATHMQPADQHAAESGIVSQ